jgi:hypothetical protein
MNLLTCAPDFNLAVRRSTYLVVRDYAPRYGQNHSCLVQEEDDINTSEKPGLAYTLEELH